MNVETAAALRCRIESDPEAHFSSLQTATDKALAIGQDVWRLRWRNQITTAIAEDADLHTTCGALLHALAVFETATADRDRTLDRSTLNVLIDRPLPDGDLSETDQAVRSLRDAVSGVQVPEPGADFYTLTITRSGEGQGEVHIDGQGADSPRGPLGVVVA